MRHSWLPALAFLLCPLAALALTAEATLPDPAQENRAQHLFYAFRCVVCHGQSIADSDAALAQDIRGEIRHQIEEGKNDAEIRDYLAVRFGDSILMRPPFTWHTAPLWIAPLLLLLAGLTLLWKTARKPSA